MFDGDGDAVALSDRSERGEEGAKLAPGFIERKSGRDIARAGAAEDDDRGADAGGGGEGVFGVAERGIQFGGGAGQADFRWEEVIADFAGEAAALQAFEEG